MRRLFLLGSFFILLAGLFLLWQYRFERTPGVGTYRLSDVHPVTDLPEGVTWQGTQKDPALTLRVDRNTPEVVALIQLPHLPPTNWIDVRFKIAARDLKPGAEEWDDGRCIIEWRGENRSAPTLENDQFASVRFNQTGTVGRAVLGPDRGPAIPVLRLENRGLSGGMEISMIEISSLRERATWKIGRWFLMGGWIGWFMVCIGPVGRYRVVRPLLAATTMLLMGVFFVVPGPWKIIHPFGTPFQIGPENLSPHSAPAASPQILVPAKAIKSVGRLPVKGGFVLRVKIYAAKIRPLLHALMLLGPTLLLAIWIGVKRTLPMMVGLAFAVEIAQISFGYGYDITDLFDLLNDITGIALGILIYQMLSKSKNSLIQKLIILKA